MPVQLRRVSVRLQSEREAWRWRHPDEEKQIPAVVWIWGGTNEAMYQEILKQNVPVGHCESADPISALSYVGNIMSNNGGNFRNPIFLLDDRGNKFGHLKRTHLQKLLLSLICKCVNVRGPHNLVLRRVPNKLTHVYIISHLSPRALLNMAGLHMTANICEIDLSPETIAR
jgi:hypothetical protein